VRKYQVRELGAFAKVASSDLFDKGFVEFEICLEQECAVHDLDLKMKFAIKIDFKILTFGLTNLKSG
jgi:hypothetical protein